LDGAPGVTSTGKPPGRLAATPVNVHFRNRYEELVHPRRPPDLVCVARSRHLAEAGEECHPLNTGNVRYSENTPVGEASDGRATATLASRPR
jgi:hypothetical protein